MHWSGPVRERIVNAGVVSLTTLVVGLGLYFTNLGHRLDNLGYDLLFFETPTESVPPRAPAKVADVIIIRMEDGLREGIDEAKRARVRKQCTQLLNHLTNAGCRLVVLDVIFRKPVQEEGVDRELAAAMKSVGCVVLASNSSNEEEPPVLPIDLFRDCAKAWGDVAVPLEGVRWQSEKFRTNGLPRIAASLWMELTDRRPVSWPETLWLQYYGRRSPLKTIPFDWALEQTLDLFTNKVVFIGAEAGDLCRTPYSRWGAPDFAGVDILATAFLNLIGNESFLPMSSAKAVALLVLASVTFGCALSRVRPVIGAGLALLMALGLSWLALDCIWRFHVWFSWLTIVAGQLPCAWLYSAWRYRQLVRGPRPLPATDGLQPERLLTPALHPGMVAPETAPSSEGETLRDAVHAAPGAPLLVPDHELLRCVGRGGYGEVWMARNTIGLFQAVKVVYRDRFKEPGPYEREFKGIQKYMPVSLNHLGLIHMLQVGRNDAQGYFYYVMELGDDERSGQRFDPATYSPRDLAKEIKIHGRFSVAQCLEWFIPLADALKYLHEQQLIHRDIKPSNIIFVRGIPKLADIGLVTEVSGSGDASYAGTEGYIPPEGPGDPAADIFALGKVIYEAGTAQDRHAYPSLPSHVNSEEEMKQILQLMPIVTKACRPNVLARYSSVDDLHADLLRLRSKLQKAS